MKLLTNLSRILTGGLFIFSGFIKANDPMGFGFKLEEYFEVFGTLFMVPLAMPMAIIICVFEVLLGIWLLLGKYKKLTIRLLLLMIVFFTFLTFYSAYFDKVTDCGCFGDAIPLTPWQSFTKDVILLILILILLAGEKHIKEVSPAKLGNRIATIGTLISLIFPLYTYRYLPIKDFRPYKIGNDVVELSKTIRQPDIEMVFIYEKDGEQFEFPADALPSNLGDYTFVDRKDKVIDPGEPAPIHDFIFSDEQGDTSATGVFLGQKGYKLLTVQYDLEKTDLDLQDDMELLEKQLLEKNIPSYHVCAANTEQIEGLNTSMTYYTVDKTALKTIIRSNPGLVLFKDNTIIMKWPSTRFPSVDDVMEYAK